jgi:kynurenine formamidase
MLAPGPRALYRRPTAGAAGCSAVTAVRALLSRAVRRLNVGRIARRALANSGGARLAMRTRMEGSMRRTHGLLPGVAHLAAFLLAVAPAHGQVPDPRAYRVVDLSHPFGARTLYWPTSPSAFRLERLAYGPTPAGYFYAANAFSAPEHGGTHFDAPLHFAEGKHSTAEVPLERLVAPAVVIDVSARAASDRDYRLRREDVAEFEGRHGRIPPGVIVLLRTGWSRFYPDRKAYFGDDTPGDASKLRFPSYGPEAAELLVRERRVAALGADVASIDYGRSNDFRVHRIAAADNVPGLENLTNLDQLPPTGALVVALPMKIEGGSGGPLRAIAMVPK